MPPHGRAPGDVGAGVGVLSWRVPGRWQQSSVLQRRLHEARAVLTFSGLADLRTGLGAAATSPLGKGRAMQRVVEQDPALLASSPKPAEPCWMMPSWDLKLLFQGCC